MMLVSLVGKLESKFQYRTQQQQQDQSQQKVECWDSSNHHGHGQQPPVGILSHDKHEAPKTQTTTTTNETTSRTSTAESCTVKTLTSNIIHRNDDPIVLGETNDESMSIGTNIVHVYDNEPGCSSTDPLNHHHHPTTDHNKKDHDIEIFYQWTGTWWFGTDLSTENNNNIVKYPFLYTNKTTTTTTDDNNKHNNVNSNSSMKDNQTNKDNHRIEERTKVQSSTTLLMEEETTVTTKPNERSTSLSNVIVAMTLDNHNSQSDQNPDERNTSTMQEIVVVPTSQSSMDVNNVNDSRSKPEKQDITTDDKTLTQVPVGDDHNIVSSVHSKQSNHHQHSTLSTICNKIHGVWVGYFETPKATTSSFKKSSSKNTKVSLLQKIPETFTITSAIVKKKQKCHDKKGELDHDSCIWTFEKFDEQQEQQQQKKLQNQNEQKETTVVAIESIIPDASESKSSTDKPVTETMGHSSEIPVPIGNVSACVFNDEKEKTSEEKVNEKDDNDNDYVVILNGNGENIYGKFELIGYYTPITQEMICQRRYTIMYDLTNKNTKSSNLKFEPSIGRGRKRRASYSSYEESKRITSSLTTTTPTTHHHPATATGTNTHLMESSSSQAYNTETSTAAEQQKQRAHNTRKRQLSWKRRAAYGDDSDETNKNNNNDSTISFQSGNVSNNASPSSKRRSVTVGTATMDNQIEHLQVGGTLKSLFHNNISQGVENKKGNYYNNMDESNSSSIDTTTNSNIGGSNMSIPEKTGDSNQKNQIEPTMIKSKLVEGQQPIDGKNASSVVQGVSHVVPKKPKKNDSTSVSHSSNKIGNQSGGLSITIPTIPSNQLKLPAAGDENKARWRAAHFLYYQQLPITPSTTNPLSSDNGHSGTNTPTSVNEKGPNIKSRSSESNNNTATSIIPPNTKYVVYEGELFNSQRHGRGICLYSNHLLYEGDWRHDKEHGYGALMTSDRKQTIYKGQWERGRVHGNGIYYYNANNKIVNNPDESSGNSKASSTKADVRKSTTSSTTDVLSLVIGEPQQEVNDNGLFEGVESTSGSTDLTETYYDGEFKENLRHGLGTYFFPDGSIYAGMWQNGMMNGRGLFKWADGSYYDGEWKDCKRNGLGLLKVSDGFSYEGPWVNNTMEGRGTAIYPNGQQYIGMFHNGCRNGRGTLSFTNGAVYEGRFRDDNIDGQGTLKIDRPIVISSSSKKKAAFSSLEETTVGTEKTTTEDISNNKETEEKNDYMIPLSFQSDMGHIHRKAGFSVGGE